MKPKELFGLAIITVIAAAVGWLTISLLAHAFPNADFPKGTAGGMPVFAALVPVIWKTIIKGVPAPQAPATSPPPATPMTGLPGKKDVSSNDCEGRAKYYENRKEEYKAAFIKENTKVVGLTAKLRQCKGENGGLSLERLRLNRYYAALTVCAWLAVCHFIAGLIQTAAYTWFPTDRPWYVNFMESLLLIPCAFFIPFWRYRQYLTQSNGPGSLGDAVFIGGLGALLAGMVFFCQISPEMMRDLFAGDFVKNHPAPFIPLTSGYAISFFLFLILQRLFLIPLLACLGCILVLLGAQNRRLIVPQEAD